MLKKHRTYLYT